MFAVPAAAGAAQPNLALAENGGVVSVSSEWYGGPSSTLNDGVRQAYSGYWADDPWSGPRPAWAQIAWARPQTLGSVVLRMPIVSAAYSEWVRTFGRLRVSYWDGTAWVGVPAANNPIVNWLVPTTDDGTQVKVLRFSAVTTTKVRVDFEIANGPGDSGLEEIEAYAPAGPDANLALVANGGKVAVSSVNPGSPASGLNDGVRQAYSGYWADSRGGPKPAWAEISWDEAQEIGSVVVRMPVAVTPDPLNQGTFGRLRVQWWNESGDAWFDVPAPNNPIVDWVVPSVDDGTQIRALAFSSVTTRKIRVLFEVADGLGDAGLEEIEAYAPPESGGNLALSRKGGHVTASSTAPGFSASALNDAVAQVESGYWAGDRTGPSPAWAQVSWLSHRMIDRVVVRMPVVDPRHTLAERTVGRVRVQYWNDPWPSVPEWVDVPGGVIENWVIPTSDDGTQVRTLTFPTVISDRIRVFFEIPNGLGDAGLEEIEAYGAP